MSGELDLSLYKERPWNSEQEPDAWGLCFPGEESMWVVDIALVLKTEDEARAELKKWKAKRVGHVDPPKVLPLILK